MTRVLLASPSAELADRIRQGVGDDMVAVTTGMLPQDPAELLQAVAGWPAPEVVVLDTGDAPTAAVALAAAVRQQLPGVGLVLVGEQDAETALAALRAGVSDLLPSEVGTAELATALARAARAAAGQPGPAEVPAGRTDRGRVVSVVSPKGGVGKTTVATNLAVGLAQRWPGSTVLVDLDIQFGDVASALDLEPRHHLGDAVTGQASRDSMALKTVLTRHHTGLHVICAPESPVDADAVGEQDVSHLLQVLAAEFRYVVVDTAPGLSEHTLSALDQTTDLVLLTSMDVPGVRGLRKELDTLDRLGMQPTSRHVVLNFTDRRSLLSVADVEFTIGTAVDVRLPRSKAAPDSVDQGVPLLLSGVRDPMTRQLRTLLDRLAPTDATAGHSPTVTAEARTPARTSARRRWWSPSGPRRAATRWRRTAVAS